MGCIWSWGCRVNFGRSVVFHGMICGIDVIFVVWLIEVGLAAVVVFFDVIYCCCYWFVSSFVSSRCVIRVDGVVYLRRQQLHLERREKLPNVSSHLQSRRHTRHRHNHHLQSLIQWDNHKKSWLQCRSRWCTSVMICVVIACVKIRGWLRQLMMSAASWWWGGLREPPLAAVGSFSWGLSLCNRKYATVNITMQRAIVIVKK